MTMFDDMAFGQRGRAVTVPVAIATLLALGPCERAAGQEDSGTESESTESSVDAGPDWAIVEDYLARQNAWTAQIRKQVLAEVPDDLPSPGTREGNGPQPRIVVVSAPGDGSLSRDEMEKRLREAIERRNDDGSSDIQPPDEGSRALVDELLRAAAGAQGSAKVVSFPSGDGEPPDAGGNTASDRPDIQEQPAHGGHGLGGAQPPDVGRAASAAVAILEQGGAHEKTVEAAEFLVNHAAMAPGGAGYASRGASALLEFAPDYQGWRFMLPRLHALARFGPDRRAAAAGVFRVLAAEAEDPVLRASGRYYVAAGRMQFANAPGIAEEDRVARRQRALETATGLSSGVEEEAFPGDTRTFAEAEADLIRGIRHGTVGGKLPDLSGSRLDGVEERLSDYRGRVLLLDFWATWCVPCVAALPRKRQLVADLPANRFALLSISVDAELETVTGFMEDKPMPWANWHVGTTSEITRALNVVSYPTYILVDEHGEILDRTNHLPDDFVALIEETVGRGVEQAGGGRVVPFPGRQAATRPGRGSDGRR